MAKEINVKDIVTSQDLDEILQNIAQALTDLNSRLEAVEAIEDGNNITY